MSGFIKQSMDSLTFKVIVAVGKSNFAIGREGSIPWTLKGDLAYFRDTTIASDDENLSNVVIMGRKTYESIPKKFQPLPSRLNVVLSRNPNVREECSGGLPESVLSASSLTAALDLLSSEQYASKINQVFIIGGASLYREALESPRCSEVLLTMVDTEVLDADCFFPQVDALRFRLLSRSEPQEENGLKYSFLRFESVPTAGKLVGEPVVSATPNEEEAQYLRLCDDIINNGVQRGDRTGTGTLSKFGVQMRFSLRNEVFPMLTTKRVFWRGVAEELLWFVKGCTNAKELQDKDIHIWDGNGSKEFLASRGLGHREEGDLGPVYGFQWRHFGAGYSDMHADYRGQGVDQLAECIRKIKETPEDRRILLTAWNPKDLDLMALPPCHMFCQFYVAEGELSCQMYQRSADMGLGVPFNIASYSLLTRMVAQVCGLRAGDFVHTIGDAHVYLNHVDALKEQVARAPMARPFPTLKIDPSVTDIDGFTMENFTIEGYKPMPAIKMKMAV
jgi:dihydrofolate reductase/thymidylate synthase